MTIDDRDAFSSSGHLQGLMSGSGDMSGGELLSSSESHVDEAAGSGVSSWLVNSGGEVAG